MSKTITAKQFNDAMHKVFEALAMLPEVENDLEEKVKIFSIVRSVIGYEIKKRGVVVNG